MASNAGPSTATGASVTDPLALNPAIASDTWTATGTGGATGFSASGSGNIGDSVTIPAGGSVTYTVTAAIRSSATGTLVNTATASASDASTVTATDSDSLTAHATLGITKTDGVTSVTAGTTDTYTVVVSNTGPSDASNLSVVDTLPTQGFTNISSPNLPSGVTFTAASDSWTLASLPAGQSVTLQLAGTVPSGATGSTYVNTASASAADASTVTRHRLRHPDCPGHPGHHQDRRGDLDHGRHHRHLHRGRLEHRTLGRHQPERGRHPAQPGLLATSPARTCRRA